MIRVILAATDGSSHAKKAVALASELAAKCDARLVLLHVLLRDASSATLRQIAKRRSLTKEQRDLLDNYEAEGVVELADAGMFAGGFVAVPPPDALLQAIGAQILDAAEAVALKAGATSILKSVASGDAANAVLDHAKRQKADIIVIGSRGLGDLAGFFLGSVSHKVSADATCPCLTVK